ncbi:MAG: nucleotidyl transferase AbiEii/AbiGii toxin family protein [Planctomycetes bacterium]|nr:nucleotidyl transferase AbiEii/AbiGii toxin family protein [Planctomycetota bacterium]
MSETPKDLVASIHRRLLNGARGRGEDFQLTLLRFGAERLLYRLCQSPHGERFILKGALLLLLWSDQLYRPTRDVDLEGFGDADPDHLRDVFRSVCQQPCPEDALRFDEGSVQAQEIRTAQEYGGVRVTLYA